MAKLRSNLIGTQWMLYDCGALHHNRVRHQNSEVILASHDKPAEIALELYKPLSESCCGAAL